MKNLYALFYEQVEYVPHKFAITYNERSITYLQLACGVDSISNRLLEMGIVPNDRVIIYMPNSIDTVKAMLAVHKVGALVLPLDSSLPETRVQKIFHDSQATVIICGSDEIAASLDALTFVIPTYYVDPDSVAPTTTLSNFLDNELAFCIYTSGSEGKPKGVLLPHETVYNQIEGKKQLLGLTTQSVLCQSLSIGFVASIWQIYGSLIIGAHLVIYPDSIIKNPLLFFEKVNRDGIQVVSLVPQLLHSYCLLVEGRHKQLDLKHLQYVILTGEKLNGDVVRSFYRLYRIPIINAYGQSECSDDTFYFKVPFDFADIHVPIGSPTLGVSPFLVDEYLGLLEGPGIGELCIGGPCLSKGYLNDETLTSQKFIVHEVLNMRVFRTGDYVKRTDEGLYIYLGRLDNQIKLRGYRISLEEVEYHVQQYKKIRKASAATIEMDGNTKEIVAFYISDELVNYTDIRRFLLKELAPYAVPSRFIQVDDFIYTSSGKRDRKRMVEQFAASSANICDSIKSDVLDEQVIQIIKSTVPAELTKDLTKDTAFEDLSISSIDFIQIVVACESTFNITFEETMISYALFTRVTDLIAYIKERVEVAAFIRE
ncbi:AMP-binding protein [Paenibacillus sp. GCM10012306]|uniref:non-ribosomal peptide synthetase n=1 Tax=Paenibacillus sp. GCM10012306 TaxID=3317342 RepID=UPI00361B44FA